MIACFFSQTCMWFANSRYTPEPSDSTRWPLHVTGRQVESSKLTPSCIARNFHALAEFPTQALEMPYTITTTTLNSIAFGRAPRRGETGQNMLYIGYLIILDGQSIKKISFGNFHF